MKTVQTYQHAIELVDKTIKLGYEAQMKRFQLKIALLREMYTLEPEFYLDKLNQKEKIVEFKKFRVLFSDAFGKPYDSDIGIWYYRERKRWQEARDKLSK